MNAYKFDVSISEEGRIQLPLENEILGKEVEIIIIPKVEKKTVKKQVVTDFLDKWAGFFREIDADQARYEYLMEKYK